MQPENSPHLYHGSSILAVVLEPCQAHTQSRQPNEQLAAVYASHLRTAVIPFALPIHPNDQGECFWSLYFVKREPRVVIRAGRFDPSGVGYLYRVPVEPFERLDAFQWVSYTSVMPIDYERIHASDYAHWITVE